MKAADIMTSEVISVRSGMTVREAASVLLEHRISAAPVENERGAMIGIVSESDLIRRIEIDTEPRQSWLSLLFMDTETLRQDFIRSHADGVVDLMTTPVVTAMEDSPAREIAALMEEHRIKRVPIVHGERVVGIVSRADLLRAFARSPIPQGTADDRVTQGVLEALRDGKRQRNGKEKPSGSRRDEPSA